VDVNLDIPMEVRFSDRGYSMKDIFDILAAVRLILSDLSRVF